jgi:hypothetical protein
VFERTDALLGSQQQSKLPVIKTTSTIVWAMLA